MAKKKKARDLTGKKCGCPKGAKKISTKGRGRGFACTVKAKMPRFVKKNANGSCPRGAKVKNMTNKNGTKIRRCMKKVDGTKFTKMVCK